VTVKKNLFYPVPVNNTLNIRFNNLVEDTKVDLISSTGILFESKIIPAYSDVATIDVQNIENGIYLCHIKNNTINSISRFIVIR
jgi:hypothetical protein